ncbi:hypothetical protein BU16DRAFT_596954 [Lophium mytilinum]|uniref:Imidazoleglycerol-phosphate dehydratase n=1 Tax=Lophium mytilinum TaxID=390894 RepID=A0A6A6QE26_9PEZI|nr:hypothetical protein BU16DRAFT_596954 [Lophium mytilinum]
MTSRTHKSLDDADAKEAGWEAARGAGVGAMKWGAFAGLCGVTAYTFSPVYRGLTVQFKVYIQMAFMIVGSAVEGDKRMLAYEHRLRHQRRQARDLELWRRYEAGFEERGTPGVGGEGGVHRVEEEK